jgi:hypothetical protein
MPSDASVDKCDALIPFSLYWPALPIGRRDLLDPRVSGRERPAGV